MLRESCFKQARVGSELKTTFQIIRGPSLLSFFFLAKIHDLHAAFSVIFLVSILLAFKRHIRNSLVTPSTVKP